MKKNLISLMMFVSSTLMLWAQLPSNYYDSIDQKYGRDLKMALYDVVGNHTMYSYSDLWAQYPKTDYIEGSQNASGQYQCFDYYSDTKRYFPGNGNAISGMNKEHVAPQSWWGGGTSKGVGTDLFQVLPSDGTANSSKGNYPLGIVSSVSKDFGRCRTGHDKNGKMVFEPADKYKGDFARIYFYDAVVYYNTKWQNSGGVTCPFTKGEYPTIDMTYVQMLLEWNASDPVDEWEMTRQERVYKLQKNRNPFIDYPELANYIWGSKSTTPFDLSTAELHVITPIEPDDPDKPDNPDNPDGPDNPDNPDNPEVQPGDVLFYETFDGVTEGDNTSSGGSSKLWDGNENFTMVDVIYQAGGAVRVGTSKKTGELQTRRLNFNGGILIVEVYVKGWTSVEGPLQVSASGSQVQNVSYTATMNQNFEKVTVTLTNIQANPFVNFATTSKRCFIDSIKIMSGNTVTPTSLPMISTVSDSNPQIYYDLSGRRYTVRPERPGLYIVNGKKVMIK